MLNVEFRKKKNQLYKRIQNKNIIAIKKIMIKIKSKKKLEEKIENKIL
jgi:hypothetical protein